MPGFAEEPKNPTSSFKTLQGYLGLYLIHNEHTCIFLSLSPTTFVFMLAVLTIEHLHEFFVIIQKQSFKLSTC